LRRRRSYNIQKCDSRKGSESMFNRLQAIRAAVFGISFDFICLFAGILIGIIVHHYTSYISYYTSHIIYYHSYMNMFIVLSCTGLALLTFCATWATLKPYIIYGGLHSVVWFVAVALATGFSNPLPLAIGLFATIFLFIQLDQIMLFLHNLKRPRILFDNAMPKQPRYEPGTPLDTSTYYQGGYQPQKSAQDSEQTLFYPQSSDGQDRVQLHYPEM
jgi:hypothetical protein